MLKLDRIIYRSEDVLYKSSAIILVLMGIYVAIISLIDFVTKMNSVSTIENTLGLVENILLILVLASLVHTVRLTIISKKLRPKPYLIVGIIASLRRLIILTVEASIAIEDEQKYDFEKVLLEIGVLTLVVLVLVFAIKVIKSGNLEDEST